MLKNLRNKLIILLGITVLPLLLCVVVKSVIASYAISLVITASLIYLLRNGTKV